MKIYLQIPTTILTFTISTLMPVIPEHIAPTDPTQRWSLAQERADENKGIVAEAYEAIAGRAYEAITSRAQAGIFHFPIVGLKNLGNTCYFNGGLQPLLHLKIFNTIKIPANASLFVINFMNLYHKMQQTPPSTVISPTAFYMQQFTDIFQPLGHQLYGQEDAQEFLAPLLYAMNNADINLFNLERVSVLQCETCKTTSAKEEFENMLIVAIPKEERHPSVQTLLNKHFIKRELDALCSTCHPRAEVNSKKEEIENQVRVKFSIDKNTELKIAKDVPDNIKSAYKEFSKKVETYTGTLNTKHSQQSKLKSLPDVLIIMLKRFEHDSMTGVLSKITKHVEIPLEINMQDYMYTAQDTPIPYTLHGITYQAGTLKGGHYTAAVLNEAENAWYFFNDTSVQKLEAAPLDEKFCKNKTPYLLVYVKKQ